MDLDDAVVNAGGGNGPEWYMWRWKGAKQDGRVWNVGHGSINHVSLTVSSLARADAFFKPLFEFLEYKQVEELPGLSVWISPSTDTAINFWQASPELAAKGHQQYAPGFHHLAFNAGSRAQVDQFHDLLIEHSVTVLDHPAEYDYSPGYYAVFFLGPDGMKFEVVHIPAPT